MNYRIINNNKERYLLFLSCICGNEKIFKQQFNMLKKYYNFVFVDFPGHGKDKTVKTNFSFNNIALDIIEIFKNENINNADVIAISLGSMILDDLLMMAPKDMFNKVVFTSTLIGFPLNIIGYVFDFFTKIIPIFPRIIYMWPITYIMLPKKIDKFYLKRLRRNSLNMNKYVLFNYFSIMNNYMKHSHTKNFNYLKNYCKDYLFINGSIDIFTVRLKKNMKNSSHLIVIPNATHLCNISSSCNYNKLIENFLI